jgi:beta-1,4-mannosyltransferase
VAPAGRPSPPPGRAAIACLSSAGWNPYLGLLYDHLDREGVPFEPGARLTFAWLAGPPLRRVRWLHVHWPESLYRLQRGPKPLRGLLSWLKLGLFAVRLLFARAVGYRIVWTIHQVLPHERTGRIDLAAARILARLSDVLVAHDTATAARVAATLGAAGRRVVVVPHGSYVGVYPAGQGRASARAGLGVGGERVALCFGELRGHKDVDVLLDGFARVEAAAVLVVAGHPKDATVAETIEGAAAKDPRIRPRLQFVPNDEVADLFAAADVAVVPRGDGGTSGSLILALSFGLPVVAADREAYRELTADGAAGWLFAPGEPESLARTLSAALTAPDEELRRRGDLAGGEAAALLWDESARRLAGLLRGRYT